MSFLRCGFIGLWLLSGTLGCQSPHHARSAGLAEEPSDAAPSTVPYDGPLIDTHAHIVSYASLSQDSPTFRVDHRDEDARDDALQTARHLESMDANRIGCVVGFHAVSLAQPGDPDYRDRDADVQAKLLGHALRLKRDHGDRFKLFAEVFRDNPLSWYDAERFSSMLDSGAFSGIGEIAMANIPFSDANFDPRVISTFPDDPALLAIYALAGERGVPVMVHPGSLQGLDTAIAHDPRTPWVIHGWQVHDEWTNLDALDDLFRTHPNLYYTLDFAESLPEHLELMKGRRGAEEDAFLPYMDEHMDHGVHRMTEEWRELIEAWPGRFMWGTDLARPRWQWENPEILAAIVQQNRQFLGTLDPDKADAIGWQTAERVFGPCAP